MKLQHSPLRRWAYFSAALIIVVVVNLPIIMLILNSFRTTGEMMTEVSFLPRRPSLVNYEYLTYRTHFWIFFKNSMVVCSLATAICILAAALAGYALSRFRSRITAGFSQVLLAVQMFPIILALIPLFLIFRFLQLVDTHVPVVIVYAAFQLPFATWMFRSFFDSIPVDLEEAAQIDGCSKFQAFRHIVLPLASAALAAVTIFAFLFNYNEYLIANVFLRSERLMTIPVGIQMFVQQYGMDLGNLMAAATLGMVPTFIMFLFVQKYLLYSAIGGAVKG